MRFRFELFTILALCSFAIGSRGATVEQAGAREILRKVHRACGQVKAVSMTASLEGTGALAGAWPSWSGRAVVERVGGPNSTSTKIRIRGETAGPGRQPGKMGFAFDGETTFFLHLGNKTLSVGDLKSDDEVWIRFYTDPLITYTEFQSEIDAPVVKFEGQVDVHDVLCNVVYVEYTAQPDTPKARWYFSVRDHLPRKVERLRRTDSGEGAVVLTVTELTVNPRIEESEFRIALPEGFKKLTAPPKSKIETQSNAAARAKLVEAWALSTAYPDRVAAHVQENKDFFGATGASTLLGIRLADALLREILAAPPPDEVREHAALLAAEVGLPHLGGPVGDDMVRMNGELLSVARDLGALMKMMPSLARGDLSSYKNSTLYANASAIWELVEFSDVYSANELKGLRDLTQQMIEWYMGLLVQELQATGG